MSYREHCDRYMADALNAGLSWHVANAIRRDAQRIHTISEQECNGTLYRCEEPMPDHCGRPMVLNAVYQVYNINGPGPLRYARTADRETPARERIEKAAASIGASVEFQGDPRGWPVTITLADGRTLCPPCRG